MVRIDLINGYFIEIDPLNYTLKQTYISEKTQKEAEKIIGYFGTLEGALKRFLERNQIDVLPDTGMDLSTYLGMVLDANLNAVKAIMSVINNKGGNKK